MSKDAQDSSKSKEMTELDWLSLRRELQSDSNGEAYKDNRETFSQRGINTIKRNPFVPLGLAATVYCLVSGFRSFLRFDSQGSQRMMRGRVTFQFLTVVAIVAGVGFSAKNVAKDAD